ncbi:hypothetical protein [Amycolatopsis sp. NPDC051128]|uniref:hypothetical protein n=1 Tax=Amycolatopsis sp. NPDC051128 TaxID=3155412 RepID=UPI0034296132
MTRYATFDEMFDHEEIASVNPSPPAPSNSPTSARSTHPNAKRWASSRSASNWSTHPDRTP